MKKILSVLLCIVMLVSSFAIPTLAADIDFERSDNSFTAFLAKTVDWVFTALVEGINSVMQENDKFVSEDEYVYDNFYEGTAEFIDEAAPDARWSLGSADASLVPENWSDYELYLGGFISEQNFFTNDVREILDDMKVRVIAMNDGSGRGTSVFATVDSIGMSNGDIRVIRESLADFAEEMGINSINIFATHTHSGIDTQGLWTDIFGKWPFNILNTFTGIGELEQGTDSKYMAFLFDTVKAAIEDAVADMETGTMTYAEKDIGEKYFNNKNRPSASALDTELKRFTFTPDSGSRPTIILNMSAHPDVVGLATESDPTKGHGVSGDYIYYIGETLSNAGYDFMFFNGAIAGIYIGKLQTHTEKRVEIVEDYGKEIGQMTLAMTMSEAEIMADDYLMSLNLPAEKTEGLEYTPWYEGWVAAEEETVEPILNIRLQKVELPITNPVIKAAGKLGVVNYLVKVADDGSYTVNTEIGYMEMGKNIKIAMVPGEFCADLAYGGSSLTAEGSIWGEAFEGKTLADIFGEDVIVFGLANDAIGYIIPDNDYCMSLAFGHYHETLSLGKNTASKIMEAFETMHNS